MNEKLKSHTGGGYRKRMESDRGDHKGQFTTAGMQKSK